MASKGKASSIARPMSTALECVIDGWTGAFGARQPQLLIFLRRIPIIQPAELSYDTCICM